MLAVGDKCCFLYFKDGTPLWLVGQVREIVPGVGHHVITVRKDYQEAIAPYDCAIVAPDFVFADWSDAAKQMDKIDSLLNASIAGYNGNYDWEKEWASGLPQATSSLAPAQSEPQGADSPL